MKRKFFLIVGAAFVLAAFLVPVIRHESVTAGAGGRGAFLKQQGLSESLAETVQQAYLKASNTGIEDWFGHSVAISGETVVVGAPLEDSNATGVNGDQNNKVARGAGAVYVFTRSSEGVWSQQAYLKASNTEADDVFGHSVAVSGDTIVVGAIRESSNATGVNGDQSNNTAPHSGAAYIFTRSAGVWSQQAYLKASNTGMGDEFGFSVAVSGETVVVGAHFEASNATGVNGNQSNDTVLEAGAAYVFTRNAGVWSQQAYLKASNTGMKDYFGYSVAVSGETVVVGAPGESSNATGVNGDQSNNAAPASGAAYVFTRNAGVWSQQAYLKASNTETEDVFGYSVVNSDETIVVGAPGESCNATGVNGDQNNNTAPDSGAVYVFTRSAGVWSQQAYLKASNTQTEDGFGYSVAVTGETVVVGAVGESSNATGVNGDQSNNAASLAGAVYIFTRSAGVWSQQAYLKASNTEAYDYFGNSVAVSGETVVVGAYFEDSNATGVNGDQSNNAASLAGASYVFVSPGSGQPRAVRAVGAMARVGQPVAMTIECDSLGNENAFGFSVGFDPARLGFVSAVLGPDASNAQLLVNHSQVTQGRVGLALAFPAGQTLAFGKREIVILNFNLPANSPPGQLAISFGDLPVTRLVVNDKAESLQVSWIPGLLIIPGVVTSVSAGSYYENELASESIIAAFGSNLSTTTQSATILPLPTELGGTRVTVRDSLGTERPAPLFYVDPAQVNYLLPKGTATGTATVTITSSNGSVSIGTVNVTVVAPALFSADASGKGLAAANILRVKADGSQSYEQIIKYDEVQKIYLPIPIDLGPETDKVFLILYGTGFRANSGLSFVNLKLGGTIVEVFYTGPQDTYAGLDQCNALIPRTLAGRNEIDIELVVHGKTANLLKTWVK